MYEKEQYLLVIDTFIIYESIGGSSSTLSGVVSFANSGLPVSGNQGIYRADWMYLFIGPLHGQNFVHVFEF
jgi:hypothetical protein